jgi:hypothetical protein
MMNLSEIVSKRDVYKVTIINKTEHARGSEWASYTGETTATGHMDAKKNVVHKYFAAWSKAINMSYKKLRGLHTGIPEEQFKVETTLVQPTTTADDYRKAKDGE